MNRPAPLTAEDDGRAATGWALQGLAGSAGALALLPVVLTLGLLAYAALGTAAPQTGVYAAFVTAGIGGLLYAACSRTRLPVSGPTSATALTLATLVAQLASDPGLAPAGSVGATGVAGIAALCGLAVLLGGTLQVAFALLGLARLVRVVPQPVLAGFMNSAAVLIVLSQLPLLLDLPLGVQPRWQDLQTLSWGPLALGLLTAGTIWLLDGRWPRVPAALVGLLAGTAVHALCAMQPALPSLGSTIGPLPSAWPGPPPLLALLGPSGMALLQAHAWPVAATALALATLGALESSLNVRAVDQLLNDRHEPRRELIVLGCANMASGLLGGLPLVANRARALATLQAGGRGRRAALAGSAALGLLYIVGGPVLAVLPLPVLAGVMLVVGVGLADRWTGRLLQRWWSGDHSRDLALGLGVVVLVVGATLWRGMPAGVAVGVLLSLVTFAWRMNRSLVHLRYSASARPSRRIYPAAVEATLRPLREGIVVFELDGALFFGSGDRLHDEADALDASCRCLVLDLRRVHTIDESGAVALQGTVLRAARRGIRVELAGLLQGSAPAQALGSFTASMTHWPDADRAIEAAERHLLAQAGGSGDATAMTELPLAASSLMQGLDTAQCALVEAQMQPLQLQPGEALFAEGDPGDRLFVLTRGSVSILSRPDAQGHAQRYLSVSPGMMIGEAAMLDGAGRTAAAVADAPTEVRALTQQALDSLSRSHPELTTRLYRNMALHLSQRLRGATVAWHASAR